MEIEESKVVLFDGVCNFCNWAVNFIIKRDKENLFMFAPSQSKAGQEVIKKFKLGKNGHETIVLISNGEIFVRSEAVMEIFKYLGSGWKYLRVLKIFPRKFRDWGYTVFAKFRYKIFGKQNECIVPSDDIKERFMI